MTSLLIQAICELHQNWRLAFEKGELLLISKYVSELAQFCLMLLYILAFLLFYSTIKGWGQVWQHGLSCSVCSLLKLYKNQEGFFNTDVLPAAVTVQFMIHFRYYNLCKSSIFLP